MKYYASSDIGKILIVVSVLALPLSVGAVGRPDVNARMGTFEARMAQAQDRIQEVQTRSQNVSGMASLNTVPMDFGGWTFSPNVLGNTRSFTFTVTNEMRGPQF